MDVEADSFTVASDLHFIEKGFSSTSLTWKIACFQKRLTNKDSKIVSPTFRFCNKCWELTVQYDVNTTIFLKCFGINSTSTCTIYLTSITVSDQNGKIRSKISDRSDVYCFCSGPSSSKSIFSSSYINKFVSSLTVSLNMSSEENIKPVFQESINDKKKERLLGCTLKLFSDFEKLYENRQLSDVTLKLGEVEFSAHKLVLSARSKVFAAMFEHDMKENLQGTVDLVQMEAETVQDMLRYIYCAKVRELSSTEALNLYIAADRYDLPELGDFCREVITTDISVNNVFDIAAVADIRNDELLIKELKSFMAANGKDMINSDKWKEVFSRNPILLAKMLEWSLSGK